MSIAPQKIGNRYRLMEPLGQGGMGRVWKARDEVLHRDVAIKELVPPPGLTDDERREMRDRSLREARAIARLNHANVVRVFDVLRTDGDPWIVMEYVPSRSLQDVIASEGRLPAARVAEIGLGVLGALRAAHRAGMMHRDVKPGNVLLGEDGRVVLTDFGLATGPGDPNVTRTGLVLGSPAYIAPERAKDGTAGPEADLWSLGATLYAAVEGASPFARSSAIATLAALATEPVPPAPHAGPLKAVLNGLLEKDPADRVSGEAAERMLRRVTRRRGGRSISLLDGVRRPGPNGPRSPRTTDSAPVPAPRTAEEATDSAADQPVPGAAAAGAIAAGAAAGAAASKKATASERPLDDTRIDAESVNAEAGSAAADAGLSGAGSANEPTTVVPGDAPTTAVPGPSFRPGVASARGKGVDPGTRSIDPAPVGGRAPIPPPGERPESPLARRKGWLIGALVAVLLLGLIVMLPKLLGGDGTDPVTEAEGERTATASAAPTTSEDEPSAEPSPTTAPTTTPAQPTEQPTGFQVPQGWRMHKDPTGFSVPVPEGWTNRTDRYGNRVFEDPASARWFLIGQTNTPKSDPVADWTDQERRRKGDYADYDRVTIKEIDYWDKAADWEWTYTKNGVRLHTVNRGFVTAPDKAYAIRWETPEAEWAENLPNLKIISDGFKPAKQ